jgi:choline dehydrogenase-like flavoprotein
MRHFVDLYVVPTRAAANPRHHQKDIGVRDYYVVDGVKYGVVQSFGKLPPGSMIARNLENSIRNRFALLAICLRLVRPWLAALLDRKFSRSVILASILEDRPYAGNQVALSDAKSPHGENSLLLHYRVSAPEQARIKRFRALMKQVLAPYRYTLIKAAEDNERLAHACGTCRFGDDPASSVLDRDNKAHGLSNLYVVDASFFPSSGGTNPSLTIAANALRVADKILARFPDSPEDRVGGSISRATSHTISSVVSR